MSVAGELLPAVPQLRPATQLPAAPLHANALAPAGTWDDSRCFYSLDGVVHGPVPFAALQTRVGLGQLAPTDFVWIEGQPSWVEASRILAFPNKKQTAASWFQAHMAVVVCVIGIGFLLIAIPAWYVISLARDRETKQEQAAVALQKAHEDEQQAIQKRLDRLDKERSELLETERFIEQQRNTLQLELAQVQAESERHKKILEEMERYRQQQDENARRMEQKMQEIADAKRAEAAAIDRANADADRRFMEGQYQAGQRAREAEWNADRRHDESMGRGGWF